MHFKRTKPLFWKTTSFVVLFCFTVTTVAWSNPSLGSASLSLALPRPFRELGTLSLPEALGRVDEVYLPEGINLNSPLIVFLQDAHANLGAQEHIAQIANEVGKKLKIDAIFKEGGSGEADLTELRNFPDQKIKSSVAQFWMEEAVLSGIEREAIVNPKPYRFFGIEDQTAYETGGKYFVEAHTRSSDFLTPLKSLVQNNDTQRKQFYNPALFRFEELVSKFETKQELIPLVSLVANEARNLHINRWKYLEIEKFIDLILLELEGARTERFFEIQKTLEAKKLFEEMELLKGEIKEKLFQNKKERILDREAEILKVLKALVSLECTPQDFERFLKHRSSISKYVTKRKLNPKAIEAAEAFYQSAHERDQLLFSNVKQILEREQIKRAFLVAGGFHSPGMIEQFRKNKIPYVLITPQISERDLYDRYFARIAGKRASIEDFKSKRPNLANVSAYAAVSALLNGEEPKIIFNSMRLTKKRIEISGNVSDSARGIVQPVTSKKATIWNVFAYLRGARQYQLWKGLSGLLEFPSHSPPLWVGYNMIAIMTSISIALTKPIFQLKGNSPNNLVARPAVPINWAKVIADLAINWLFAVPISLSMLSKIGTDTLYAAHRNKVSVPFLFLGGNFDKESPRAEVRSTPVGLSTLAPQAMESLRAEVRIDLSRAQTIDQKTQLEVGGILIKGRNRWVIRSTKPNYVEVQSVDEKGVPVSKFRVPMFRGTFNGAKYISPVSEKPKIEKKEYKPAPQAIPTPVAAAITEKVQAPEPAKVIPKPEKQISSPVMPMTEQASQPEQVGELLSKDQAKFMLGYGFISKDELNQLLSDQRYSSYSHRDVLQKYFIEGMRAQAVAEWTQSSEYARTGERPLKGHTSVEGAIELWLERFIKDDFFRSRKKAIEEAANQYLPELDKTRAIFMAFGGFNERKEPLTEDEMVQFTGKSPVYIHHRKKIAVEIVRRAVATPTKEVLTSLLERLRKRLSVKRWYNREPQNQYAIEELDRILTELRPRVSDQIATAEPKEVQKLTLSVMDDSRLDSHLNLLAKAIENHNEESQKTELDYFLKITPSSSEELKTWLEKLMGKINFKNREQNQEAKNLAVLTILTELKSKLKPEDREDYSFLAKLTIEFLDFWGHYRGETTALLKNFFESIPESLLYESKELDLLTKLGELRLAVLSTLGDRNARSRLIEYLIDMYSEMVDRQIERFTVLYLFADLDTEELREAAQIGLQFAAEHWSPRNRNFVFQVYAFRWIEQAMLVRLKWMTGEIDIYDELQQIASGRKPYYQLPSPRKSEQIKGRAEVRYLENSSKQISIKAPLSPRSEAKRAEVHLTSVKSSTSQPPTKESRRAEVRVQISSEDIKDAFQWVGQEPYPFLVRAALMGIREGKMNDRIKAEAFARHLLGLQPDPEEKAHDFVIFLFSRVPLSQGSFEFLTQKGIEQIQFRHPRFLQSNDKFPVDPLTKRKLQALYQLMISPQATGQYEIVVDPQKSLAIVFEAKRAEVREKDSSEFKVSSLKLEKLETRNPKLETNFNRAEVRSIPVESSTLVPWAKESPRAEVRAARLEEDKRLLEGLGKNPVFYEETPDWQRVNVIGQIVLDKIHERPGPVKLEEILDTVRRKLEAQGINATVNVEALLNRLVDAGLIASRNGGYGLVVRREIFAVKVDHVRYIQDDFEKALEAISGSERHATIRLGRLVADYARVTSRWPLYPVESRWPVLRAVALMAPEKQKQLLEFFETEGSALWKFDLVDSIMLMLQPEPPRKWLSYHAPRLIGRTLYYISPETWLAAGGLGRVGQYHTIKIKELIGNDAQVATIEAYYPWTLNAEGKEEKADYGALPVPVEGLTSSPTMEFDVVVRGRTVKAQIFKGKNRFGIEVYLIKDTENFYTRLLYRYGSEFGSARWEEFSEFFSRASLELVRVLEEGKQASLKRDYKAPVLWANDGQLGPLPFFKRILDEHRDSLRNALVWMTTHTYPNRGFYYGNNRYDPIQGMKVPNDKWHYFEEKDPKTGEDRIDYTSAGVRNADGANGVSVVQRDEVAPLDPHIRLLAITNGDNREASSEVFRSILKELYPSADPEFPEPAQIMEVKKEAKRRLDLNPDQIVISYSGRLVPEKAGRKRAFDNDNIRALVEEGAQVVIYGNVQSHTKGMFEELVVLSHEVNQKGPGKLIVVTGWGIPEQRKLLAATDIQVQDSDRATGAAEYTEADISVNGGLQLGPPWLEGVIQRHGIILDRNVPGSGNTVIPVNKSKEAYLNALLWIVELFKQKREKLASYQATSIRLSRILDARLTAAEYLRQFHSALERKEDPVGTLEDHIAGKPVGQFFQSEWLRNDLINALQRSYAVSFDSTNSKLTAFVVESVGGIPGIISVETGVRTDGEKVWGEINNKKGEEEKAFGALLDFLQLEKPTDEVRVVDGVTREKYGSYPRDWFLNRGLLVGVKNFQVLHFEKGELPTALPKPTIADRASIFYSDATSNEIREVVQSLIPNGLFQNLAQKGFRKGNLIWWTPVEGFYPENLAPKSWLDQGFYLIVNKGEGHLVLTLTPTLTGYFDPGYRGRTFLTSGAFAHIALDVEGDTLWVRFGRMETFPEAEAENQEHYEDPAFRFWFLHNLKDFAEKYSFASIKIEQFNLSDNLLENLGFKRITERTVTQPAVWQFEVRPNKNHVFLSTTPRAEVRSIPVESSTLAPQAAESPRAEVRSIRSDGGESRWSVFDRFVQKLNTLSREQLEAVDKETALGRKRKFLIEAGIEEARHVDARYLVSAVAKAVEKKKPGSTEKDQTIRWTELLSYGGVGRYLIAYRDENPEDGLVVKIPVNEERLRHINLYALDGARVAIKRLNGLAAVLLIVDGRANQKPFIFNAEGRRIEAPVAIVQEKILPFVEYLKKIGRKGASETDILKSIEYVEKFKKLVVEMYKRGVIDIDTFNIVGNYGIRKSDDSIVLFDVGDLSERKSDAQDFVRNLERYVGLIGESLQEIDGVFLDERIGRYFLGHPLKQSDFFANSHDLFGSAYDPQKSHMVFPYSEDQVRSMFAGQYSLPFEGRRAEVRSIPVESSTLAPQAAESPRAEVRSIRLKQSDIEMKSEGTEDPKRRNEAVVSELKAKKIGQDQKIFGKKYYVVQAEYPQVDYIYDDELWRITAQLSDVHFIRLNISLKDDAQAKVVEWSLSKGFQSTDFKWEGNPILAVKVKSNGSFEFIVARNFIMKLNTYFAHKYSDGEASEILNVLVGDSKVPKKITRSHNRAEVRNIENSPKEVSIEAPLSPRSEAKRAEVRLRAEMRLPGEGEQHRIQILARERARSLFLGEGFTVFDRPVEVHSDDRSVAIDALAEPSEDSSRFLVKVFVRFKNPELIHFFKQQRAFYYVSKRKNIASFLYRNEIAVGLVRIIPSMIKGISESFPAKIPEQVTPKAQEESSREPLATTITELVMSSQEKKRVYGLLSKIQQEHPGVSLVKLVPPIELTGDASLMRYLLWRIDKQFVKGIKSLPSLDESERIETFRQKVQSLVGSNQLHRAEVRSIPVESSTLAPRAAESPRAEVREVEWRKLSDRGRAKLSDYAFSADQPSKGSQLRQESQKRQSEGNQAFFVPSIRGGLLGDRTTPKANRTTIIIPETTRTATGKRANPPVINAVPNRISDSLNNELDNLSRRYDSSIGDTIAPEVRGVNKNYNEYDKKLIPPRRAEVRGHVERPAIIPPLLKKYKSKLKGLNTSQAARVMGVSEPGLSLHFHAHPEYFGRYGIVRGKAGRIPTITDKDQQLINHYIRLVQQKKGVLPTVQVLADQFRVSHQAISDRIRALKGKGVVLKTKYARRAEVRHIENSPKEVSIEAPLSPRSEAKRAEAKKRLIIPLAKLSDAAFQEKFLEILKQRGKDPNLEFAILATGFELQAEREVLALFRERNIFVEYNVQLFGSERFGQDVKSEAALMNRVIELMRKEVGLRGREFSTRVITVGDTRLLERIGRRDTPKLLARPEAIDAALLLFELDGEIDWFKIAPNGYIDPTRGFIASLEHLRLTSLSFNRAA